ncbi:KAP family P-loop NTPase fold protein [Mycolicibacterium sp. XJ870]
MSAVGDNPITIPDQDLLGRQRVAAALARDVRRADSSEGYVFGVVGPWGSGKTSLLHLMMSELASEPSLTVITFNPWMFAGTEQLLEAFFHELSSQLRETKDEKFRTIATTVDSYANLFSPITLIPWVGAWYERFLKTAKAAKQFSDSKRPSISAKRRELTNMMSELERPIVVTIDDIDRLSSREIRDLFKLVRLTGNFPNLVYVLAFDRLRVEQALSESGLDGRVYLEKIVQHGVRLPEIPTADLASLLLTSLNGEIRDLEEFPFFDQHRWTDVLVEIVLPLIRNIRDIRRYVASFGSAVRDVGQVINVTDLLALEAIKVFLPDRFDRLIRNRESLTTNARQSDARLAAQVTDLLDGLADDELAKEVLTALINRVFPVASRHLGGGMYGDDFVSVWLRERRVVHPDILSLYIERLEPESLADFIDAEKAFTLLSDRNELENFLRLLQRERVEKVIGAMTHFETQLQAAHVVPGVSALLNLLAEVPERERSGFLDFGTEATFRGTIWRLLKIIDDPIAAAPLVSEILSNVASLSSKFLLVRMVGHREGTGHNVINEEDASNFEKSVVGQITDADPIELLEEWDLLTLLSTPVYWELAQSPVVTDFSIAMAALHRRIFEKARTESRSNLVGDRAVRIQAELYWDSLIKIYGDDEAIRRGLESASQTAGDGSDPFAETIALVEKYLGGWRPRGQ